jgi:hypothetical protein
MIRAVAVASLACLALAGCGGGDDVAADGGGRPGDGAPLDGGGDVPAGETSRGGPRAFDVTATVTLMPPAGQEGGWQDFPRTLTFTLVRDPAVGRVFASAGGAVSAAAVTTTDDRTFRTTGPLAVTLPFPQSCTRVATVAYDELTFSEDGGALAGTARGTVSYPSGNQAWTAPATARLAGAPDATAPTLALPGEPVDPLAPLAFPASEPLPSTAAASIVGATSGDVIPLAPAFEDGPDGAIGGFSKPNVALRDGETYGLVMEGFVDFEGNAPTSAPGTFTTRAAPPLAPEDGFESVTATMFGGAGVLHDGPLQPIAGATSLLLNTGFGGGFGFLPYALGPSLAVRLAVAPGDTVVRFDGQLVAPDPIDDAAFVGAIRLASVGQAVGMAMNVAATGFAKVTLPGAGDVFISPVKTIELPLPAGAAGEITFEIEGVTFACGLPPSPTVLVLDNLRVE